MEQWELDFRQISQGLLKDLQMILCPNVGWKYWKIACQQSTIRNVGIGGYDLLFGRGFFIGEHLPQIAQLANIKEEMVII